MLARAARPTPLEPEGVHLVLGGGCPGGDLAGPDLSPRGVVDLDAPSFRRRGWTAQRLGATARLPRDLDAPFGEVVLDLDLDRRELDPEHLVDQLGEAGRPPACLPAED